MTLPNVGDRFWNNVLKGPNPNDCWIWLGAIGDDGYGRMWMPGDDAVRTHRYAWQLITGRQLTAGEPLRHHCDLPLCVHATPTNTTSHIWPGTNRENMLDRSARGRFANQHTGLLTRTSPRAHRAALMRTLRDHLKEHGYDHRAIADTRAGYDTSHPTLFDI